MNNPDNLNWYGNLTIDNIEHKAPAGHKMFWSVVVEGDL